jgi:hypothetical protein
LCAAWACEPPCSALIAAWGFFHILFSPTNFLREIRYALVLFVAGVAIYLARAALRKEWLLVTLFEAAYG